jgi:hypothetical protein
VQRCGVGARYPMRMARLRMLASAKGDAAVQQMPIFPLNVVALPAATVRGFAGAGWLHRCNPFTTQLANAHLHSGSPHDL